MRTCSACTDVLDDDAVVCVRCGGPLEASTDPLLGRTVAARYRLIKRLGAGGMSTVYLARHVMIERLGAIKFLRHDLSLNPQHRERFVREARAVNRIHHRNIVEITDYGEADGRVYLVMEYVQGESLLAHVKKGQLPWPRAAKVAAQIAGALGRAHQAGVIHRDLKPENVMLLPPDGVAEGPSVADEDAVKLMDFGIAKLLDAPALTFNEGLFGTPGYIAPEFLEGERGDGRSDLYALGVVLYEMITGSLPYDARGQAALLLTPLTRAPTPPGAKVRGLPPELESLVLRLLGRHPHDRPQDAFVVQDALVELLRAHGHLPAPPEWARDAAGRGGRARTLPLTARAGAANRAVDGPVDVAPSTVRMLPRDTLVDLATRPPPTTRDPGRASTRDFGGDWQGALIDVGQRIARARERGGAHAEAADHAYALARQAAELLARVDRTRVQVADAQARVDRLEAHGREFRATLGRAIDELVRDRSRERVRPGADVAVQDLTFQIDTLQHRLDNSNEAHERELVDAAGALEGLLSGLRRLERELVRALDDVVAAVSVRGG